MRILIIDAFRSHDPRFGGHAIRVYGIAREVVRRGHSVVLLRPGKSAGWLNQGGVRIYSLREGRRVPRFLAVLQRYVFKGRPHFVDSIALNLPSSIPIVRSFVNASDIIQVEDPTIIMPLILSRLCGRPCVMDGDGIASRVELNSLLERRFSPMSVLIFSILSICEQLSYRIASKVITSSSTDKELVSNICRIPRNKISVVPNPVDYTPETGNTNYARSVRSVYNIEPLTPVAIFIGNLNAPHNAEAVDYIETDLMTEEKVTKSNLHILIVGECGTRQARKSRVIFTGAVDDVSPFIAAADVCIAPLRAQPTGVKTKILTYLAYGKPTVATPIALTGLNPRVKNFIHECEIMKFPATLLQVVYGSRNTARNSLASETVLSSYGLEAVGSSYEAQILKSEIQISTSNK